MHCNTEMVSLMRSALCYYYGSLNGLKETCDKFLQGSCHECVVTCLCCPHNPDPRLKLCLVYPDTDSHACRLQLLHLVVFFRVQKSPSWQQQVVWQSFGIIAHPICELWACQKWPTQLEQTIHLLNICICITNLASHRVQCRVIQADCWCMVFRVGE